MQAHGVTFTLLSITTPPLSNSKISIGLYKFKVNRKETYGIKTGRVPFEVESGGQGDEESIWE
jgi:hypothetical protein